MIFGNYSDFFLVILQEYLQKYLIFNEYKLQFIMRF